MGFSHRQVAQRFVEGKRATGHSMYTRDKVIYSYGSHFPIALDLGQGVYLFNSERNSSQTAGHQWLVRSALREQEIHECTTVEIRNAIRNPGKPIVTVKLEEHDTLRGAFDNIYSICKREGMTKVPKEKWLNMITEEKNMSIFRKGVKSRDNKLRYKALELASKLLDAERYKKECFKTLLKLLGDPDIDVIKMACNVLIKRFLVMSNVAIAKVEEAFKGINHEDYPYEYLGLMQIKYLDHRGIALMPLFLAEDGVKYMRICEESWERRALTSLSVSDLKKDYMRVGKYEDAIVTSTVAPEVLENMLALFTLCDL